MTGVFNIDLEPDCFRKNTLDWRKFRESYKRVSATKLERGIQPLPFSLLLKLAGPQKVFHTYVISNRPTNVSDVLPLIESKEKESDMKNTDTAVTKTVEFPGTGLLNGVGEGHYDSLKQGTKQLKRDALPMRPAFQRGIRVPGRYFPKPSTGLEDSLNVTASSDYSLVRQKTQTPRTMHSHTPHKLIRGATVHSSQGFKTPGLYRGSHSRNTEPLSPTTSRSHPWSGLSTSSTVTMQSMPALHTNGRSALQAPGSSINGKSEAGRDSNSFGLKSDNQDGLNGRRNDSQNGGSDSQSDIFSIKRLNTGTRHVSFPKSRADFSTVLQGRPKTLHSRDPADDWAREPRSRTHVGFAIIDT